VEDESPSPFDDLTPHRLFDNMLPAAEQLLLRTNLTASPLCFDDGLVAGPKEIFLAYCLNQSPTLHHLPRVVVDSREHECAILPKQSFMQTMDGFQSGSVNE
jgi:hypothetical protein